MEQPLCRVGAGDLPIAWIPCHCWDPGLLQAAGQLPFSRPGPFNERLSGVQWTGV